MGKRCHVKIIEDPNTGNAKYEVNIKGKKIEYFPEEVSSEILKEIKKIAEKYNKNGKKSNAKEKHEDSKDKSSSNRIIKGKKIKRGILYHVDGKNDRKKKKFKVNDGKRKKCKR